MKFARVLLYGVACTTVCTLGQVRLTAETIVARETGGDSFRWDNEDAWSPRQVPDGVGVSVRIDKDEGEDRNINLGSTGNTGGFTISRLFSRIDVEFRNRVRRGSLRFEASTGGNAEIHVHGAGGGRLEFRMDEDTDQVVFLASELHTFIAADHPETELRFRGNLSGPGGLHLLGPGEVRFRVSDLTSGSALEPYTYTGPTVIGNGVLRLRQADLTGTSAITVRDGGQLRLDARLGGEPDGQPMNVTYSLGGGPLTLAGMGRDENNPNLSGVSGALRQHGRGTPSDVATLNNAILLAEDAAIHTNSEVETGGSVLRLTGPISGPGQLIKTGGGTLELHGANTSGGLVIENGTVELLSPAALDNQPLFFRSRSSTRTLTTGYSHSVSELDGTAPDPALDEENTLFLRLGSGTTFTVDLPFALDGEDEVDRRFQGEISGDADFVKDGAGTLRFTRFAKTYTGSTTIREGVLAVSESAALAGTREIRVENGGQLLLSSLGDPVPAEYHFGGPLHLRGTGRIGVPEGGGLGVMGALRYDPGSGASAAVLRSALVVEERASIHVNGAAKSLELAGPLSGNGQWVRSGGGTLILSGSGSLQAGIELINGTTRITGDTVLAGGSLLFSDGNNEAILDITRGSHRVSGLSGPGNRSALRLDPGATLRIESGGHSSLPFMGTVFGGGHLVRSGSGSTRFEGTLNGLAGIEVETGQLHILNGASSIGQIAVAPGGVIELRGAFFDTPFLMDGRWIVPAGIPGAFIYIESDALVGGRIEIAMSMEDSPYGLIRFGADLSFKPGAQLILNTGGVGLSEGGIAVVEVAGSLAGLENLSVLVDGLPTTNLLFVDGLLHVLPEEPADSVDPVLLNALLGPFLSRFGGYHRSVWLSGFYTRLFNRDVRWIYHEAHTWWWIADSEAQEDGLWIHDLDLGWIWTTPSIYPIFFAHSLEGWVYFEDASAEGRTFLQISSTDWILVPFGEGFPVF
ncbi:MAG: autotransporter-associated beta strand repeat-containing protein [Opitutales bacterium]|nr:autotransporter-associated beta strand repeat-containing protein [Opitutales bacterium]